MVEKDRTRETGFPFFHTLNSAFWHFVCDICLTITIITLVCMRTNNISVAPQKSMYNSIQFGRHAFQSEKSHFVAILRRKHALGGMFSS